MSNQPPDDTLQPQHPAMGIHPRALAHLGDAVYELWIREWAIEVAGKSKDLHRFTVRHVNAAIQARLLEALLPTLSPEEQALAKRAANMPVTSARRADHNTHRRATAFEALIGYWHLADPKALPAWKDRILQQLKEFSEAGATV